MSSSKKSSPDAEPEWRRTLIHLLSGGAGGTMGAILTCPFEVVKTRLQSSNALCSSSSNFYSSNPWECLRLLVRYEGVGGLFKGLGPNLVGVAPARAIYFWAYSTTKNSVNSCLPRRNRDTPFVHIVSAATAGFTASTVTNPIWLIKTRLQLDQTTGSRYGRIRRCVAQILDKHGPTGFWKGVTASYWGISETAIHFVIYEYLKSKALSRQQNHQQRSDKKSISDFAAFMLCGACSKTCATIVAYPHEVARTRLREEGSKYNSFWQTLSVVYREEGRGGLYRGLLTQLIRQIPNTAIMMATYELSVHFLTQWLRGKSDEEENNVQSL